MPDTDTCQTENGALIARLVELQTPTAYPTEVAHYQHVVTSDGTVLTLDSRREWQAAQPHPQRTRGHTQVHSIQAMVDLVGQRTGNELDTVVTYADEKSLTYTTVLNDHTVAFAGWGDHRITYTLELSPAMQAWVAKDRAMVDQTTFAEHIEDRLRDISEPSAADMLEIAQTFSATTSTDFRSGIRLQSGVTRLQYLQEQEAKAGQARELDIPARFQITIAPFVGAATETITARFRWRLNGGSLGLGYILDDVAELKLSAFHALLDDLRERSDWLVISATAP